LPKALVGDYVDLSRGVGESEFINLGGSFVVRKIVMSAAVCGTY
jgi:hypothetical protein